MSLLRTRVATRSSEERLVRTKINGKSYGISSDDDYLDHVEGEFEPEMVSLFKSLLQPTDTVLDVGANIGCTSLLFGDLARKVYSFEPSPTTYRWLVENVQRAKLNNVETINLGLGKEAGTFELTFAPNNRSGGFVSNLTSASEGHQVEQITIVRGDDFISERKIAKVDFIKIDVEGFEQSVIEGLAATIARDQPIVALELNHWCLNAFQRTAVPDFFDFLRSVFPYLYAVDMRYVSNLRDRLRRELLPFLYEKKDARNLHDQDAAYHVMYRHILHGSSYPTLVGAFKPIQLNALSSTFGIQLAGREEMMR
ncbi:MAG: FkbM family methyltransferase [Alcaligenaceae bacterium]|nr:FkbM family methyltransferase [Alcaligenaceae bacterium]